jgi:hypothetical protein
MARAKRTVASSNSSLSFFQEPTLSVRVVLSLRISFVFSGASQKPFLDIMTSISLSRFSFPPTSKITSKLFQPILKRFDFSL